MVKKYTNRRSFLATLGTFPLLPVIAQAEEYIDLEWTDLLPVGQAAYSPKANNIIQHNQDSLLAQQPKSKGVRTDWNGQIVRLPGFVVPIEYSGNSVKAFILVPFLGACIHVPPPPANQLVFVTTAKPYKSAGLHAPVNVIGMFGTASQSTQLADISYALSADIIKPYGTL
tara:strand:+ start:2691 stop:3203 length:513 start_codon:yes stop_codon:yes gene_type:complete